MQERIQKILSQRGICSRRKAEEYIERGLVTVNGQVAKLGDKADPKTDTIEVDGQVVEDRAQMQYYLLHKPMGVVTTNKSTAEQTAVIDILPKDLQGAVYPVGRLDKDTTGLLLLTNDGVLAYRLTHPSFYHEKEYEVHTQEPIKDGQLQKLRQGMTISGEKTKPATVKRLSESRFTIALTEGKNRQIRRMCQKVGAPLQDLKRIRIVTLSDTTLPEGELRPLTKQEVQTLLQSLEIPT